MEYDAKEAASVAAEKWKEEDTAALKLTAWVRGVRVRKWVFEQGYEGVPLLVAKRRMVIEATVRSTARDKRALILRYMKKKIQAEEERRALRILKPFFRVVLSVIVERKVKSAAIKRKVNAATLIQQVWRGRVSRRISAPARASRKVERVRALAARSTLRGQKLGSPINDNVRAVSRLRNVVALARFQFQRATGMYAYTPQIGDSVVAMWRGLPPWYPGRIFTIKAPNPNERSKFVMEQESFAVRFDDGSIDRAVPRACLRPLRLPRESANSEERKITESGAATNMEKNHANRLKNRPNELNFGEPSIPSFGARIQNTLFKKKRLETARLRSLRARVAVMESQLGSAGVKEGVVSIRMIVGERACFLMELEQASRTKAGLPAYTRVKRDLCCTRRYNATKKQRSVRHASHNQRSSVVRSGEKRQVVGDSRLRHSGHGEDDTASSDCVHLWYLRTPHVAPICDLAIARPAYFGDNRNARLLLEGFTAIFECGTAQHTLPGALKMTTATLYSPQMKPSGGRLPKISRDFPAAITQNGWRSKPLVLLGRPSSTLTPIVDIQVSRNPEPGDSPFEDESILLCNAGYTVLPDDLGGFGLDRGLKIWVKHASCSLLKCRLAYLKQQVADLEVELGRSGHFHAKNKDISATQVAPTTALERNSLENSQSKATLQSSNAPHRISALERIVAQLDLSTHQCSRLWNAFASTSRYGGGANILSSRADNIIQKTSSEVVSRAGFFVWLGLRIENFGRWPAFIFATAGCDFQKVKKNRRIQDCNAEEESDLNKEERDNALITLSNGCSAEAWAAEELRGKSAMTVQLGVLHRDGAGPGETDRRVLDKTDWLRTVAMLALFDKATLLDWVFRYADKDSSGSLEVHEFQAAVSELHRSSTDYIKGQVERSLDVFIPSLEDYNKSWKQDSAQQCSVLTTLRGREGVALIGDTRRAARFDPGAHVQRKDLDRLHRRFPVVLYPLFDLQRRLVEKTLGKVFWQKLRKRFSEERATLLEELAAQKVLRDCCRKNEENDALLQLKEDKLYKALLRGKTVYDVEKELGQKIPSDVRKNVAKRVVKEKKRRLLEDLKAQEA